MLVMAASMSLSVGCGVSASIAAAAMIIPLWQYPHCGTCWLIQACCNGCERLCDRPSMVVILRPPASLSGNEQDRTAPPSTCTVQAPHAGQPEMVADDPQERRARIGIDRRGAAIDGELDHAGPRVMIEHDLFRKPISTFRDHTLALGERQAGGRERQRAHTPAACRRDGVDARGVDRNR